MNTLVERLRPQSIRSKLAWWFTAAIVLAVGLVFLLILVQQQRLIRSEWSDGLRAQARLMAASSQAAWDFQDRQEATRLLQMVHSSPSVLRARLLATGKRQPFAEFVRAGATLLYDSIPEEEEAETELKASAMIAAIRDAKAGNSAMTKRDVAKVGQGVKILLVDHEDSFVHTLANYFRQTGASVTTVRTPVPEEVFDRIKPDLVVLSPGPGNPKDFDCKATIRKARERNLPIFGVCLGLQALAEAYGGE